VNTLSGACKRRECISLFQPTGKRTAAGCAGRSRQGESAGVSLTDLFGTLQTYLGSSYVNDFNQFGRTWRVMAQADGPFRDSVEDIANLRTRNNQGEMVPIGSMVNISTTYGPDPVIRYNGYRRRI
jgi:multidrug efflux pump